MNLATTRLAGIMFLAVLEMASAAVIYVPQNQPTIQAAINVALDGDTILVSPGVYKERIVFLGKNVTVASLFLTSGSSDYIVQTIIKADSANPGSTVTIAKGESRLAVLCGFTITGGHGTLLEGELTLYEVFGGGIFIRRSSPTIRNNIVSRNATRRTGCGPNRGGGIAVKDSADPLIIGNTITLNSVMANCDWGNYFGGGIWIDASSNPVIGGSLSSANNIFDNYAQYGSQAFRADSGEIINARYNYWGPTAPRDAIDVFTFSQIDISNYLTDPISDVQQQNSSSPVEFQLFQNHPNPCNLETVIKYQIPQQARVTMKIYNLIGQEVRTLVDSFQTAGEHSAVWDGRDDQAQTVASGVYFYLLEMGEFKTQKKMVLLQ